MFLCFYSLCSFFLSCLLFCAVFYFTLFYFVLGCFSFSFVYISAVKWLIASKLKVFVYIIHVCVLCIYKTHTYSIYSENIYMFIHLNIHIIYSNIIIFYIIYLIYKQCIFLKYIHSCVCVCIYIYIYTYIHTYIYNKYTQYTHIYYVNKLLFCMRLIIWQH